MFSGLKIWNKHSKVCCKISPLSHLTKAGCEQPGSSLASSLGGETNVFPPCLENRQKPTLWNCVRLLCYLCPRRHKSTQKWLLLDNNHLVSLPVCTALSSRCLQLIVHYIPIIRAHFEARLQPKQFSMLRHFDHITKVILFLKHRVLLFSCALKDMSATRTMKPAFFFLYRIITTT